MADRPLGNLFVKVSADVASFTRGMTAVERGTNKAKTRLTAFRAAPLAAIGTLTLFAGAAGAAAAKLGELGAASEETQNKFKRVFAANQLQLEAFVSSFKDIAAVTTSEMQEFLATTGLIAKGLGASEEAAADLSKKVVTLAADIGSFSNIETVRVIDALNAAFNNQRRRLQELGVTLTEAEVKQKALQIAMRSGKTEAGKLEEMYATVELVAAKMSDAVGDATITMDSNARASLRGKAAWRELLDLLGAQASGMIGAIGRWTSGVAESSKTYLNLMGAFSNSEDTLEGVLERLRFLQGLGLQNTRMYGSLMTALLGYNDAALEAARANELELQMIRDADAAFKLRIELTELNAKLVEITEPIPGILSGGEAIVGTFSRMSNATQELIRRTAATGRAQREWMARQAGWTDAVEDSGDRAMASLAGVASMISSLSSTMDSEMSTFKQFLRTLGGIVSAIGTATGNPALVLAGSVVSTSASFASGGSVPPNSLGLVGERGPEIVSGPAQVTPMNVGGGVMGGGDLIIQFLTSTGREVIDTVTLKQGRDLNTGRVVRVPISAVAMV